MFAVPAAQEPVTQGDLIDGCPLLSLNPGKTSVDIATIAVQRWYLRVIVLTRACDLGQPKTDLVLIALVHSAEKLVQRGVLKANAVRDHLRRHLVFGWHFLPENTSPIAIPESIVDLRVFTRSPARFWNS